MTEQELADALRSLPLTNAPEVSITRAGWRFIAIVISPDYEDMDEFERQRMVYHLLHEKFPLHELRSIEMVLTDSPSEVVAGLATG
jgi:acid stress-induced BolA-like protein IbaG/YrbA